MSQDQPVQMVISDEFYEALSQRHASLNAQRAAQGLPPCKYEPSFISESQVKARREARRSPTAQNDPSAKPARLSWAARSKMKLRRQSIPGFERHSRKCQVCRHPEIDAIEDAYLRWYSAADISRVFKLSDFDIVYRHARAAGLDVLRRQNVRTVVERFIEQWLRVTVTPSSILRAIRALSCLDDKGRWTDPPRTHILVRGSDPRSSDSGLPEHGATSSTEKFPAIGPERMEANESAVVMDAEDGSSSLATCRSPRHSNRVNMEI